MITAAFGADSGQRVLLESDPQTLRAIDVLPEARRLAESVRNGTPVSLNLKPFTAGRVFLVPHRRTRRNPDLT